LLQGRGRFSGSDNPAQLFLELFGDRLRGPMGEAVDLLADWVGLLLGAGLAFLLERLRSDGQGAQ